MSVTGKKVFLIGGGNSAGQAAMFFSDYAAEVRLLVRSSGLAASMSQYLIDQLSKKRNIIVEPFVQVTSVGGSDKLEYLTTLNAQPGHEVLEQKRPAHALFIMIGAVANTRWLPAELERDAKGFLRTGRDLQPMANRRVPFS